MKFLQRLKVWMLAILAGGFLVSCQQQNDGYTFVTNGVADFWTIAEAGVKAAGADLGVDTQVLMPATGITEQKQMLEDLIARQVRGIAVSPIDPENQTEIINRAAESTNLVTHDSDAPNSKRLVYIGMDNYTAGRMCGQLVKEALPDGGSVMIFIGRMEQDNSKRRRQGVIDELMDRSVDPSRYDPPGKEIKNDKYTILGTLTDQFDRAKAKANAEDTLARYPDIGGMVGLFAYNPPAILQVLNQANKLGKVQVIAFDEDDETLAGIQDGHVHGTVVQNPYMYGYKSVEVLKKIDDAVTAAVDKANSAADGGSADKDTLQKVTQTAIASAVPEKFINIDGRQIRKDNVAEFWADLKKKMGKE